LQEERGQEEAAPRDRGAEGGEAADKEEKVRQRKALLEESVETIDVHREAQELKTSFTQGRRVMQMEVHAQPSSDDFSNSMQSSARQHKVRGLHLTGHSTSRCGFYWLKRKDGTEIMKWLPSIGKWLPSIG
jgi:hypothetical protein